MQQLEALKKKRAFKKVTYRGIDLDKLLDLPLLKAVELLPARIRRRFDRGLKRKHTTLLRKIRKAKKECKPLEKPATVKTHLRNMPILPEMVSPRRSGRPFWSGAAHLEHAPPWVRRAARGMARHHRTSRSLVPVFVVQVGGVVAIYNGKVFNVVEIRPEMIGHYLAEFSITYKPTLHGRPGLGATHSSRFIPLH